MASLDVRVHEKYFDTDKALTVITGKNLVLPDMRRWIDDQAVSATSGSMPAVPPDCAQVNVMETRIGTLWRDGLAYDLRYDTLKAIARKASTTPVPYHGTSTSTIAFASLLLDHQLGESCRQVMGFTGRSAAKSPSWTSTAGRRECGSRASSTTRRSRRAAPSATVRPRAIPGRQRRGGTAAKPRGQAQRDRGQGAHHRDELQLDGPGHKRV